MKSFLLKTLIIFFSIFVLYQSTIGSEIKNIKNKIELISDKSERKKFKDKIFFEMKNGLEKEYYFDNNEREIISAFIKKILTELKLNY